MQFLKYVVLRKNPSLKPQRRKYPECSTEGQKEEDCKREGKRYMGYQWVVLAKKKLKWEKGMEVKSEERIALYFSKAMKPSIHDSKNPSESQAV